MVLGGHGERGRLLRCSGLGGNEGMMEDTADVIEVTGQERR